MPSKNYRDGTKEKSNGRKSGRGGTSDKCVDTYAVPVSRERFHSQKSS